MPSTPKRLSKAAARQSNGGELPDIVKQFRKFVEEQAGIPLLTKKLLSIDLVDFLYENPELNAPGEFDPKISFNLARTEDVRASDNIAWEISSFTKAMLEQFGYFSVGDVVNDNGSHEIFLDGDFAFKVVRTKCDGILDSFEFYSNAPNVNLGELLSRRIIRADEKVLLKDVIGEKYRRLRDLLVEDFSASSELADRWINSLKIISKVKSERLRLPAIPKEPPAKYEGKSKSGEIFSFIRENYRPRSSEENLTASYLEENDPTALRAYYNRQRATEVPEDARILTREDVNDELLAAYGIDLSNAQGRENARRLAGVIQGRLRSEPKNEI